MRFAHLSREYPTYSKHPHKQGGHKREVDFVCDKGAERLYVQVAFVLGSEETRQREYSVLEDVRSADGKILLTMDRLDMSDGTIRHMYIPDFLSNAKR